MSHTPTPWKTWRAESDNSMNIVNAKNDYVCMVGRMGGEDGQKILSDAQHIIHCVNTHDQLVAALQRCIAALAANGAPNCEAVKEAKAALAAAEKGA